MDAVSETIFSFLNPDDIARHYLEYSDRAYLDDVCVSIKALLRTSTSQAGSWSDVIRKFEGADAIPLMTVHRSKGLEFDTMVFVGLDDDSWWSFAKERIEGLSVFFVALSRAKQRVIYTFTNSGSRVGVAELYEILKVSGVKEFKLP